MSVLARPATRRRRRAWWSIVPFAVLGAVGLGLIVTAFPVITVWMTSPGTTSAWDEPVRLTVTSWVVAHDVPVTIGRSVYSLLPWGFLLVWALLCFRTARWSARVIGILGLRDATTVALAFAVGYALIVAGTTWAVTVWAAGDGSGVGLRASPIRALGIAFVVALASGGWGVLAGADLREEGWAQVPEPVRAMLRAAAGGLLTLFAIATLLLAIGLVAGFDRAVTVQQGLNAGPVGGLVLLVISLGYLPVGVVWTASYALGTSLDLGTGVVISPFVDAAGQALLPSFPLLAALPERTFVGSWALPVVGVLAGVVIGRLAARRGASFLNRASVAVGAALLSSLALSILARVSTGSLGHVQLVALGPDSQQVAWVALLSFVIGAVPAASFGRRARVRRRDHLSPVRQPADMAGTASAPVAVEERDAVQAAPVAELVPAGAPTSQPGPRHDTVVLAAGEVALLAPGAVEATAAVPDPEAPRA